MIKLSHVVLKLQECMLWHNYEWNPQSEVTYGSFSGSYTNGMHTIHVQLFHVQYEPIFYTFMSIRHNYQFIMFSKNNLRSRQNHVHDKSFSKSTTVKAKGKNF